MTPRLIKRRYSFVDFLTADGTAGFQSISCRKLAAGCLLSRDKIAEEDVAVGESLFNNESVRGVVVQGIAKRGSFGSALGGVIVTGGLDNAAEFAIGGCKAGLGFLNVELVEFDAKVRFGQTQT